MLPRIYDREGKWGDHATIASAARELASRARLYPSGGKTIRTHLLVRRAKRAAPLPDVTVRDLDDLYGS